ncbi:MAG: trehalose-6-phosphate synthase [candidate division Zixibacteria bacterium]|nr:trehalose-6-phosphate synthase [candidate division Zixibacteria bacterium]
MNDSKAISNRLIIVSNRLPLVLNRGEDNNWEVKPGTGGLVTALAPVLKNRGGIWIGWPGVADEDRVEIEKVLRLETKTAGYTFKTVGLTSEEVEGYYQGFSNEIIWPLFHDFQSNCVFNPDYWLVYKNVNKKFAEVISKYTKENDFIWVHDYHLICIAKQLRRMKVMSKIAFFLHIPFPPLDIFVRLPWRFQILYSLLEYDLLGFQTLRDRRNFIQCVRTLLNDVNIVGKGQVVRAIWGDQETRIGAFAIGIDSKEFSNLAESQEVAERAWLIHQDIPNRKIIFGLDRLDYSKGIPERLKAYRRALEKFPELHNNVTLVQVVVPSRRDNAKYLSLKIEIEQLVSEINGQFSQTGWVPIHYHFKTLDRPELTAYYRTAEIVLLTPLKDGMNLVAKEYCACDIEGKGVLILSEFAGAAAQLQNGAILVNPHDIDGIAAAIYHAYHMSEEERIDRMKKLKRSISRRNVFWWVDSFLQAAIAKNLNNFPLLEDYIPSDDEDEEI